ncbi:Hypothetical_protein [Hexamita inflata]|uniref:Hypothetical_protein n=1 Tax=Hexamita inflata TaxID=28002 RepID=A0AA86UYR8_9EUKA|nr:Hypothetical protein HINF_LOCUS65025 [Hexamita inflata]
MTQLGICILNQITLNQLDNDKKNLLKLPQDNKYTFILYKIQKDCNYIYTYFRLKLILIIHNIGRFRPSKWLRLDRHIGLRSQLLQLYRRTQSQKLKNQLDQTCIARPAFAFLRTHVFSRSRTAHARNICWSTLNQCFKNDVRMVTFCKWYF